MFQFKWLESTKATMTSLVPVKWVSGAVTSPPPRPARRSFDSLANSRENETVSPQTYCATESRKTGVAGTSETNYLNGVADE